MKTIRKNSESIFFGVLFLLPILSYLLNLINENLFFGSLGSIATIYFGFLKLKIENDLLFKELFNSFNEKYDSKFNDLINEIKIDTNKQIIGNDRNIVIDYFNLCAEEFLWYSKKRIPNSVWKAWKAGILENLEIQQINEIYEQETSTSRGKTSYYGLYEELKKK
jgi:hypothetical protein